MITKIAFSLFKRAIQRDPELAHSYHCNLAMSYYDSIPESIYHGERHRIGNEAVTRFMGLALNTMNEGYWG